MSNNSTRTTLCHRVIVSLSLTKGFVIRSLYCLFSHIYLYVHSNVRIVGYLTWWKFSFKTPRNPVGRGPLVGCISKPSYHGWSTNPPPNVPPRNKGLIRPY